MNARALSVQKVKAGQRSAAAVLVAARTERSQAKRVKKAPSQHRAHARKLVPLARRLLLHPVQSHALVTPAQHLGSL